jgi:creatinine amidohydrolase
MDAAAVRAYIGDGNFGGAYEQPDPVMTAVWQAGVAETRAAIEGPWA